MLTRSIYYFAYGSNLHPLRLTERVPSAELIGVATCSRHRLVFHKKSRDGSGKCNMFYSGADADLVYGAIYSLSAEHKAALDRVEGTGYGYTDDQISVIHAGRHCSCFTYLAQQSHIVDSLKPYHWYKQLVVLGAQFLDFPPAYCASIEAVESMEDPDPERRSKNETLIERIIRRTLEQ